MHWSLKKVVKISLILMLTVGVICSCCSCAIHSTAMAVIATATEHENDSFVGDISYGYVDSSDVVVTAVNFQYPNDEIRTVLKGYSNILDSTLSSTVVTRCEWLKALVDKLGIEVVTDLDDEYTRFTDKDYYDNSEYFITAIENGILGSGGTLFEPYSAATRQYVSTTLVNACGYPTNYTLTCTDKKTVKDKTQAAVSVALGYLELDDNNCFNPYDYIESEQVDYIMSELDILKQLKGKTVMSFGDSIMHGDGNNGVGIADLLSQRYMMSAVDYSKGGASFAKVKDREQISNQILTALQNGDTADIILINGGTNDMRKVSPGVIAEDFEYGKHGREDFASGMEYALGLLKDNYPDVPVLYVRAHNMVYGIERNELHFGTLALDICEKWNVEVADIFNDTDFNAHDESIKLTYTVHTKNCEKGDSVHPNKLGYYEFYLPLISDKMVSLLNAQAQ